MDIEANAMPRGENPLSPFLSCASINPSSSHLGMSFFVLLKSSLSSFCIVAVICYLYRAHPSIHPVKTMNHELIFCRIFFSLGSCVLFAAGSYSPWFSFSFSFFFSFQHLALTGGSFSSFESSSSTANEIIERHSWKSVGIGGLLVAFPRQQSNRLVCYRPPPTPPTSASNPGIQSLISQVERLMHDL